MNIYNIKPARVKLNEDDLPYVVNTIASKVRTINQESCYLLINNNNNNNQVYTKTFKVQSYNTTNSILL